MAGTISARHAGDPHKLAINSPTIITNRLLGESTLDYAALTPLANLYTEYLVFVVRPGGAIRDARDLVGRSLRPIPRACRSHSRPRSAT